MTGGLGYWAGTLVVVVALGVILLLMRWTFSGGSSLVQRRPREGHEGEYGILVAVAAPGSYVEGELLRRRLEAAGLRATLTTTSDGPRIMVFPRDEQAARRVLAA
ncbi:hypothetical protein [Vallicoccus soli]|uniref:DUF2007 domain-containing protein n=1 Tax=Vallicoccus soli TaxID=2339232 RepID=A0A3A3Z5C8_9ACTN|nr:hypothetical protein [Vallicoccus soli]RJK98158.1 hypothetical protein D5H78_04380 [Vallicoccus soli]